VKNKKCVHVGKKWVKNQMMCFYYIVMGIYGFFSQISTHIYVFSMYIYYDIIICLTMDCTHSQNIQKSLNNFSIVLHKVLFFKTLNSL
jgi:hypothetical protein